MGVSFLHSLFRALGHLSGGLVRFIPCQPSAHYTRLMHVGWRQCGHGLSSRLVRVVTFIFSLLLWISLVILMEQLQSFLEALHRGLW